MKEGCQIRISEECSPWQTNASWYPKQPNYGIIIHKSRQITICKSCLIHLLTEVSLSEMQCQNQGKHYNEKD